MRRITAIVAKNIIEIARRRPVDLLQYIKFIEVTATRAQVASIKKQVVRLNNKA